MPKLCKCGRIVENWCNACYPRRHKHTTAERGYDHQWRKLSERKRRVDPLCEHCMTRGTITPATECHHIVPIVDAPHLRLNITNLMSVCRACHDQLEPQRTRS